MRRIADFETCFADAYRILTVLAEPRGSRSEAGVELTHLVKDFPLKRHIGSRETADFTHFRPIVDDGDVIFTQPIGISNLAINIYPRENTSLHSIVRAY